MKQVTGVYYGRKMTDYNGGIGNIGAVILALGLIGSVGLFFVGQIGTAISSAIGVLLIFFLCSALDKIIRILLDIRHVIINQQTVVAPQQFVQPQQIPNVQQYSNPTKSEFKVNIPEIDD